MFGVRLLFVSLGFGVLRISVVKGAGNVGCFFKPEVCQSDEFCYNDFLFGHCASPTTPPDQSRWQPNLTPALQRLLEQELKRLWLGGYRWRHEYTQCVVQNLLYADRHRLSYDPGFCARFLQMTLPTVTKDILEELEKIDPEDLALIRFNPSITESHPDFADEIFIPRTHHSKQHNIKSTLVALPDGGAFDFAESEKKRSDRARDPEPPFRPTGHSHHLLEHKGNIEKPSSMLRSLLNKLNEGLPAMSDREQDDEDGSDRFPEETVPVVESDLSSDMEQRPVYTEGGMQWVPVENSSKETKAEEDFREQASAESLEKSRTVSSKVQSKSTESRPVFINQLTPKMDERGQPKIREASEDFLEQDNEARPYPDDEDNDSMEFWRPYAEVSNVRIQEDPEMAPFTRPMRYDTKKPGPTFFIHEPDDEDSTTGSQKRDGRPEPSLANLLKLAQGNINENRLSEFERDLVDGDAGRRTKSFSAIKDLTGEEEELQGLLPKDLAKPKASIEYHSGWVFPEDKPNILGGWNYGQKGRDGMLKDNIGKTSNKREYIRPLKTSKSQEEGSASGPAGISESGNFEAVDSTQAYLLLQEGTPDYPDAEKIVNKLENLLKLPRGTFSNIKVGTNQLTFKVNPNPLNLNASVVVEKAEDLSDEIKKNLGVTIIAAGIGDKTQFEVVRKDNRDHRLFILTFVLCGGLAGVLLAVAVVYIVRRHARSRQKLQNLTQPETEASQDYQDLCRQRMQRKNNEKPEPIQVVQQPKRVSSLSQSEASQPSPSSRSSTSSWSEEPVTSNMDISTGHMILSYMEDHLKNKDRLEREWEALCAYEAEPCSTNAATLPQNVNKNRFPDVLPYDHSRVILNDLSNVSNSDYINASTITDHDPRNPAYISTQGPLPQTAADFWQMIWEQGSVVIVTLTRLMENGFAMCHRYWPEEGSEVYHIYEVHLVSEHIWCDDYLVRSFYLKNLKTSETRTVTQFHFLSWPENGVPASIKALLEFRRKVNKSYRGRSCPIVAHCSDGSGRTGTYCLIDMVLNRMAKGAKEIDIAATLEHIRDQRAGMVKTKAQFEFVLMAIAEEVHAILKALSQ